MIWETEGFEFFIHEHYRIMKTLLNFEKEIGILSSIVSEH